MMTVVPSGAFHGGARLFRHATPKISSKNRRAAKLKPIQPVSAPHALKGNLVYANPEQPSEYRGLALQLRAICAAMSFKDAQAELLTLAVCYERLADKLDRESVVPAPEQSRPKRGAAPLS